MNTRQIDISAASEHLMGVFRALLGIPKFREFVDQHFVINQYYDAEKILRVEIVERELINDAPRPVGTTVH